MRLAPRRPLRRSTSQSMSDSPLLSECLGLGRLRPFRSLEDREGVAALLPTDPLAFVAQIQDRPALAFSVSWPTGSNYFDYVPPGGVHAVHPSDPARELHA